MTTNELPFALLRWIKAQQEKELKHQEYMAKKNVDIDLEFAMFLLEVGMQRLAMTNREILFVDSLMQWKADGGRWTDTQRSAIAALYLKYVLELKKA